MQRDSRFFTDDELKEASCTTCKHGDVSVSDEPCKSCNMQYGSIKDSMFSAWKFAGWPEGTIFRVIGNRGTYRHFYELGDIVVATGGTHAENFIHCRHIVTDKSQYVHFRDLQFMSYPIGTYVEVKTTAGHRFKLGEVVRVKEFNDPYMTCENERITQIMLTKDVRAVIHETTTKSVVGSITPIQEETKMKGVTSYSSMDEIVGKRCMACVDYTTPYNEGKCRECYCTSSKPNFCFRGYPKGTVVKVLENKSPYVRHFFKVGSLARVTGTSDSGNLDLCGLTTPDVGTSQMVHPACTEITHYPIGSVLRVKRTGAHAFKIGERVVVKSHCYSTNTMLCVTDSGREQYIRTRHVNFVALGQPKSEIPTCSEESKCSTPTPKTGVRYFMFSDELQHDTLREGDVVFLGEYKYTVDYCFLSCAYNSNDAIFKELGIHDASAYASQVYGYPSKGGEWPESRDGDYNSLTRLVYILMREIEYKAGLKVVRAEPSSIAELAGRTIRIGEPIQFGEYIGEVQCKFVSILRHPNDQVFKHYGIDKKIVSQFYASTPGTVWPEVKPGVDNWEMKLTKFCMYVLHEIERYKKEHKRIVTDTCTETPAPKSTPCTYMDLASLNGKELKKYDIVVLHGEEYEVKPTYLRHNRCMNDRIFDVLGISPDNKNVIAEQAYGYLVRTDGYWPYFKEDDYAAVTRLVKILMALPLKK